jgi:hypothetical protein
MPELILNSAYGDVVLDNELAIRNHRNTERMIKNAGYQVDINTLTAISQEVVQQTFYEIPIADYVPVIVGQNSFSTDILTYKVGNASGDFEAKTFETGSGSARQTLSDTDIDSVSLKVRNYRDGISWNIFELEQASRSQRWDLVTLKETSRKTAWDLGIQKIAFLGMKADSSNYRGLLTLADVNANTTTITKYISEMTTTELNAFVRDLIADYQVNCDYNTYPDTFVIPVTDWNGLASPSSENFPINSKLEQLLKAFRLITMNPAFEIKPVAYADKVNNAGYAGLNKNRYTLYKKRSQTLRMEIPLDYTTTLQNTINGFEFQNTAYGQYTGVIATKPKEVLYFDWT